MGFEDTVERIPYRYLHPRLLHGLIRWREPQIVVEVGTHIGYAACWMARALQQNNSGHLYCIDPFCWKNENQEEQWEQNLRACGVRDWVTLLKGRSQQVPWPDHIDFAYIDGNHTYVVCQHDAELARYLGATCIVLDDTVASAGSRRFAEEIRTSWQGWDFIEDIRECGLTVAVKREPKPPSRAEDSDEQWDQPS